MDNQQLLWDIFMDALSTLPSLGDPDFVEQTSRWWASADNTLIDFAFTRDPSEAIPIYRLLAKPFQLPVLPTSIFTKFADMHLFENMCGTVIKHPHHVSQFIPLFQGYLDHLTTSTSLGWYSSDDRILQLATDELFRPRNLLITFKVLVETRDIQRMKGIGRLRPDAPAWEVLFTTFDKRTSDVAFWEPFVDSDRDPVTYNAILLEFRQNWKAERRILN
ncbi:hypothetical protein EDD85DRAFT_836057 [Armillaria nabsnona]|nr:hypothetical protein EDD85DRAFT_836057 [Armillaria nabsnona]